MRDLLHKYSAPGSIGSRKPKLGIKEDVTFSSTKHDPEISELINDLAKAGDLSG